jgi:ABC-2 type transport system ATP-binding protein
MERLVLEVHGYTKRYVRTLAARDVSFGIPAGAIVGMVGPNGAGKTTTMKAIAGIHPPTAGTILVEGFDVVRQPVEAKRRLAFVQDDPRFFDALTVWEHLRLAAALYRVERWESIAEELLVRFELDPKKNALSSELSRGMRQKLALCCAYLHDPPLIVLDEPMTGLDPHGIRTLKASIRERSTPSDLRRGTSFLVSSHLLALVEDLTTHLCIMHRGACVFVGTIDEARRRFAGGDASLEEVFFNATAAADEAANAPPPPPFPNASSAGPVGTGEA